MKKANARENQPSRSKDAVPAEKKGRAGRFGLGHSKKKSKEARFTPPVPLFALSSFKAAIFDLDGVIVDSEKVHPRTFERALARYGVRISDAHWRRHYTGIGSPAIFEDLVKRHGINEDAKALVEKRNAIYLREIKKNGLPLIQGFNQVHRMLAKSRIKEAVASGGHANHVRESMRVAGMKAPFVAIEHVKKGKPSPEIFLQAAEKLGVKPSECLVFEDSLSGVEAAARAGMVCVALSTTMPAKELAPRAALVARDFRSPRLRALLAKLIAKRRAKGKMVRLAFCNKKERRDSPARGNKRPKKRRSLR